MDRFNDHKGDRDGPPSSASAAGAGRDPAHDGKPAALPATPPTHAEIAARAHQLWLEQGRPPDSAERIWLEAEHELNAAAKSHSLIEKVHERGGSVQA